MTTVSAPSAIPRSSLHRLAAVVLALHATTAWAAEPPTLTTPLPLGATTLGGKLAAGAPAGTQVTVYRDGVALPTSPTIAGGAWSVAVAPLAGRSVVWATAKAPGDPVIGRSNVGTVLEPLPAPVLQEPLLASDLQVAGTFTCDMTAFTVSQGGQAFDVFPVVADGPVEDFYGYAAGNAATGLEVADRGALALHRDASTGDLSLVVLLDAPEDGTGGAASLKIAGLPASARLAVADDPQGPTSSYNLVTGQLSWAWDSCCTAGAAIADLTDSLCVTVTPGAIEGLTGLDVLTGTPAGPVRVALPSSTLPLTLCGVPCSAAQVAVAIDGAPTGTSQVSGGQWGVATALVLGQAVTAQASYPTYGSSPVAGPVVVQNRTAAPVLDTPIDDTTAAVTGTVPGEPDGATVTLFRNGAEIAAGALAGGTFSITAGALTPGDVLFATAQAPGKAVSFPSATVTVVAKGKALTPVIALPLIAGETEVCGEIGEADGAGVELTVNGAPAGATLAADGQWCVDLLAPLAAGDAVRATATVAGKAQSDPSPAADVLERTATPSILAPVAAGSPIVQGSVDEEDGTVVTLRVNGEAAGTDTAVSKSWSLVPSASLQIGDIVTAVAKAPGKAESLEALAIVVTESATTDAPTVDAPLIEGDKVVKGSVVQAPVALTVLVNGAIVSTDIVLEATWAVTLPAGLAAGDVVTARAKASGKATSPDAAVVVVLARTATPTLTTPVWDDDAAIAGTVAEADGTAVFVYRNGVQFGAVTTAGGAWTIASPAGLEAGDAIFARAKADGKATSFPTAEATVLFRPVTTTPTVEGPLVQGLVTIQGSVAEASGTTITVTVGGAVAGTGTVAADGAWKVTVPPLVGGATVTVTAKAAGKKPSAPAVLTVFSKTAKPTLNAPIWDTTTLITGGVDETVDGTVVEVARNGALLGAANVSNKAFSLPVSDLVPGDTITATATAPGKAPSDPSAPVTVQLKTTSNAPVITSVLIEGDVTVSGTSAEAPGTVIRVHIDGVKAGEAAMTLDTWTVSVPALAGGQKITATAQAPGKQESPASAQVTVLFRSDPPVIAGPLYAGGTAVSGTSAEADNTVVRVSVGGIATAQATVLGGTWTATVPALVEGTVVTATAQAPDEAESPPSAEVVVSPQQVSAAPVILEPLLQLDTVVTGTTTEANQTAIRVLVDGAQAGTGTASNGTWSVTVAPLELGQSVTATAQGPGKAESAESEAVLVGYKDSDGDTISDVDEGLDDPDGDDQPNAEDKDSDGDGIPDSVEAGDEDLATAPVDSDGDEIPDYLDDDSDDDGLPDAVEGAGDCDNDDTPNYLDLDSDEDGIPDAEESPDDQDGDGFVDWCDDDTVDPNGDDDNDTIRNGDEGSGDFDGDGTPNYKDPDSDGDGIPDKDEAGDADLGTAPVDSDGDGKPDYLDLDADGDTISDHDEMLSAYNAALAGSVPDADGDGERNLLDLDSDGDGIEDRAEAGDTELSTPPRDLDADGLPDFLDTDSDNDGVPDGQDNCKDVPNDAQADCDGDGVGDDCQVPKPDCWDSDGDGVPDSVDNCRDVPNPDQADCDGNGIGDACEAVQPACKVAAPADEFAGELYGGGGCQSGGRGGGSGWAPLLALLGLLATPLAWRRRKAVGLLVGLLATLLGSAWGAGAADAQTLDAQRFKPAAGTGNFISAYGSDTGTHLDFSVGFLLDYAHDPLVLYRDGEQVDSVVGDMLTGNLLLSITLFDFMQPSLTVPVNFAMLGSFEGTDLPGTTMGDLALHIKFRILDWRKTAGFGLAAVPTITFPTGNANDFSGAGTVTGLFRLVADYTIWRLKFALNMGYAVRGGSDVRNVHFGDELMFSLAASYNVIDPLTIQWELEGATAAADPFADTSEGPLEMRLGLKGAVASNLYVTGGTGVGLAHGVGTPDFRVFAGVVWSPEYRDTDGDRVPDDQDECPTEPEDWDGFEDQDGCPDPDNDEDGIFDSFDRCPLVPEDADGFEDEDGCPELDNDKDGIPDAKDKCVNTPEDVDGFMDEDGCPDTDNDGDGILDVNDQCPDQAENVNGNKDDDGCPDPDPKALIVGDRIQLFEKVHFAFGKSEVAASSYGLLDDVVAVLKEHPEVEEILVAGHTDSMGNDRFNLELSELRAQAVADYLVMAGVGQGRVIKAKGFGETEPVAPNDSEEGRERNRRVEIIITKQKARVEEVPTHLEPVPQPAPAPDAQPTPPPEPPAIDFAPDADVDDMEGGGGSRPVEISPTPSPNP